MTPLALIVALSRNRGIGLRGQLPWHVPEDLKRFKALTLGHAIVMGRATHESIGRPLPGRRNIVVSRQAKHITGCEVAPSLEAALEMVRDDAMPFIIGGAQLYGAALPRVTHLFLTEIDRDVEADTFFPEVKRAEWREAARTTGTTEGVTFVDLVRIGQ